MQLSRREFLKAGLAAYPLAVAGAARQKIVIAGAGLAGLAAAFELSDSGHEVTILEARNRPGGRIYTVRDPFTEGLHAEAGALMFPETHEFTMKYVKRFDLTLSATTMAKLFASYYIRGKKIRAADPAPLPWPQALTPDERMLGMAGMQAKYLGPGLQGLGDFKAKDWPGPNQAKFDRVTFSQYLQDQGASKEAVALLRLGYFDLLGDGVDSVSALTVLREIASGAGEKYHKIDGGNDRLPQALAERLKKSIKYQAPVLKIEPGPNHVRVAFREKGQLQSITCDRFICTLPFSVLRTVEVNRGWSTAKRAAIEQLSYTSVTKVFLQMKTRFWENSGQTGYTVTDLPVGLTGDGTFLSQGTQGLLESYVTGAEARRSAAIPEEERIAAVLETMEKVYPGARNNFVRGMSKCWDQDEWSRGAYAWFRPGQMMRLLPSIAGQEGRVHFAGDHTSPWPGWMQGAIQSGNRVAREVNEAATA